VASSDGRGSGDDHQIPVSINAPVVTTVPGPQLLKQFKNNPLPGISVADADAASAGETIRSRLLMWSPVGLDLSANSEQPGAAAAQSSSPLLHPDFIRRLTISGTLAQVNADLSTLTSSTLTLLP